MFPNLAQYNPALTTNFNPAQSVIPSLQQYTVAPQMSPVSADMMPTRFDASNFIGGAGAGTGGGISDWNWFGNKDSVGILPTVAGLAQVGLGGWLGKQQLDLAKEDMAFQKDVFNKNYANQVQTINAQMEDRARARYSANPNAYANPDEYMAKNRVGQEVK